MFFVFLSLESLGELEKAVQTLNPLQLVFPNFHSCFNLTINLTYVKFAFPLF